MGFRNPFRIQVDKNDVAYVTDYSPDSTPPTPLRAASGTGRLEIVRKPANYGWPMCYKTDLPMYKWDFNTQTTLGETYECGSPDHGPTNISRWNTGQLVTRRSPTRTSGTRSGTTCGARRASPATTRQSPPRPRIFPELGTGGVGPHGSTKYHYDPDNPSTTKFPPYYDKSVFFGEFTRNYLKEIKLGHRQQGVQDQQPAQLRRGRGDPDGVRVRQPDGPAVRRGRQLLPADVRGRLLRRQPGRRPVTGGRTSRASGHRTRCSRPTARTGQPRSRSSSPSAGTTDPDPGDALTFAWDLDGNGTTDSTDPSPSHTYTTAGVYVAKLTVTDSGRQDRHQVGHDDGGQHVADGHHQHPGGR